MHCRCAALASLLFRCHKFREFETIYMEIIGGAQGHRPWSWTRIFFVGLDISEEITGSYEPLEGIFVDYMGIIDILQECVVSELKGHGCEE